MITLLGCHGEGLPGRGPQGDQELRQVLCHPQVHDLQLENKRESRDMLLPFSCRLLSAPVTASGVFNLMLP